MAILSPDGTRLAYAQDQPIPSPDGTPLPHAQDRSVVLVDAERGDVLFQSDEAQFVISAIAMSEDVSKLAIIRMMNGGNFFRGEPLQPDPNSRNDAVKPSMGGLGGGGIGGGDGGDFLRGEPLQPDPNSRNDAVKPSMGGLGGWGIGGGGRSVIDEQSRRALALGSTVPPMTTRLPILGGHYIPLSSSVEVWDVAPRIGYGPYKSRRPLIAAAFDAEAAKLHAIGVDLRRAEIAVERPAAAEPAVGEVKPHVFGFVETGPAAMTSFSADGRRTVTLRAATSDGRISIATWSEKDESPTLLDPPSPISPQWVVALAPDGKRFVTAGVGNHVHIWDFEQRSIERTIVNGPEDVPHVAFVGFARDSSRIVTADAIGTVQVWDGDSGRPLFTLKEPVKDARNAALVDDRLTIVRGGIYRNGVDCEPLAVKTFDLKKEAMAPR